MTSKKYLRYGIHYVDIFVIANKFVELLPLLRKLNSYDQNIQFTIETEKDITLAFLDIQVKHADNKLQTRVFRKPNSNAHVKLQRLIHTSTEL